jgi:DNA-binding beta-propeller fold protein YncE
MRLLAATTYSVETLAEQLIGGSEIVDVSEDNKFAAVVGKNDVNYRLRLLNLANNTFIQPSFDLKGALVAAGYNLGLDQPVASSVAISPVDNNGTYYAIVTLREIVEQTTHPGKVVLININSAGQGSLRPGVAPITVGINPESVDIALSGEYAVVANQGGMSEGLGGTISVIDLRQGAGYNVQTYVPEAANPQPETVAISRDSARAFVTLQRSNAISILEFNTSTVPLTFTRKTQGLPTPALRPDGLAVSPDGNYLVTANEQAVNKSVSLFRINKETSTIALLQTVLTPTTGADPFGYTPEMAATGVVGGQLRAFFSLQQPNAVGVYVVDQAQGRLLFDTLVPLNVSGQPNAAGPEGLVFADGINVLVTANSESRNVSFVKVTSTEEPTPVPPAANKQYFPIVRK